MPFETALNLLWVCLGLAGLALLGWSELSAASRPACWRRVLSVLFAIIFLFPCVSASDDVISIHDLQFTLETRGELDPASHSSNQKTAGLHLARLFDLLQNFQISGLALLLLTFCCLALVIPFRRAACERHLNCLSGRSPPACA